MGKRTVLCSACRRTFTAEDDGTTATAMRVVRDHEIDFHRDLEWGSVIYRDIDTEARYVGDWMLEKGALL